MNVRSSIKSSMELEITRLEPIGHWLAAMQGSRDGHNAQLRAAYQYNLPTQGELIFTGACEFSCQHCIYGSDFARYNRPMPTSNWVRVLTDISDNLGVDTFVYGGRSVSDSGLDVMALLRNKYPNARIGLIDNGISMLPVRERLHDVKANWIDISFDGQESDHDKQRGRVGSYRSALDGAMWLFRNGVAPKVNILSCLTRLNRHSIVPMIHELNDQGFKNFFIVPITVVESERNMQNLQLSASEFAEFLDELRSSLDALDDAWVEVNMFSADYAQAVAQLAPDIWGGFKPERDGLVWKGRSGEQSNTDLYMWYYPISLTGTRELIVNTNGDLIVPKSMAKGRVSGEHVIGSLIHDSVKTLAEGLPWAPQFRFYTDELDSEINLLKEYF